MACVSIESQESDDRISHAMEYYMMEGIWARPLSFMICHLFNYGENFKIPRMIISLSFVEFGFDAPLRSFFKSILDWFDLTPLQLSPNN